MALVSDVELDNGLILNGAYLRIESFSGNEYSISFNLNIYVDKDNYQNNKRAVTSIDYSMEFNNNRNLFTQMYEYLMALPEYKNAIEA